MITGLATLELIKIVTQEYRKLDNFKNAFVNLAIPVWILSEPGQPKKAVDVDYDPICGGPMRARPAGFTSWDKIELTLKSRSRFASVYLTLCCKHSCRHLLDDSLKPMLTSSNPCSGTDTLQDVINAIERELQTEVALLSVGNFCLYNSFQKSHREKLKLSIEEVTTPDTFMLPPHTNLDTRDVQRILSDDDDVCQKP